MKENTPTKTASKILELSSERAWRTYLGGSMIDLLHGIKDGEDTHFPEEWVMSVTECRNVGREDIIGEGMSKIKGTETYFADVISKDAEKLLGEKHFQKLGDKTGVLVKIIDSAERLSIQVHPNKLMAKKYFESDFGKTESWHVLGGREINGEKPCIYLGFKEGITREYWKQVFDEQNIEKMLDCLNKIEVKTGDTFLIKGGVPHAIGSGCFLIEVQEPTDFTIRTERTTPSGFKIADGLCHQGIGFENMFDCFDYTFEDYNQYKLSPRKNGDEEVLIDYSDCECFALRRLKIKSKYFAKSEEVFSGLYVIKGKGRIVADDEIHQIEKGNQLFVPANTAFEVETDEELTIMRFNGPKV